MPYTTSIGYLYAGGGTRVRGMKGHLPERKPNTEGHTLPAVTYIYCVYTCAVYINTISCCYCTPKYDVLYIYIYT